MSKNVRHAVSFMVAANVAICLHRKGFIDKSERRFRRRRDQILARRDFASELGPELLLEVQRAVKTELARLHIYQMMQYFATNGCVVPSRFGSFFGYVTDCRNEHLLCRRSKCRFEPYGIHSTVLCMCRSKRRRAIINCCFDQ